ncbi:MAG: TlpA disulfide reductase family protein [Candidatus Thiodiazotropha sp. 6PLUC2]
MNLSLRPAYRLGYSRSSLAWSILFLFILWLSLPKAISADQRLLSEAKPLLALPFRLKDLEGEFHQLHDYRGRVVIVNFWASWCHPCRNELPSMNRAWDRLKSKSVAMLAINLGEEAEAVNAFLNDYPIDFQVLLDYQGRISQRWGVRGMPTTFVLNRRGKIIYKVVGEREWDDPVIHKQIEGLLSRDGISY